MVTRAQRKKTPARKRPAAKPVRANCAARAAAPPAVSRVGHRDEAFLTNVFNVARIGISRTDEHGYFVKVNPAVCELFG